MNQTIAPPTSLRGSLRVPGDRSITVRAVLLGSIAQGDSIVRDYLVSDDTTAAINCMRALGVDIASSSNEVWINGRGLHGLKAAANTLYCASSGASIRLLAGLMCGQAFGSVLDGSAQLRQRPMRRITEPLGLMGAKITDSDGCAPLNISPGRLHSIDYHMPVASAQVKSAVLLAGLYAEGETVIHEGATTRDHTERMLASMGCHVRIDDSTVRMQPAQGILQPIDMSVPSDFSSAAFFLVAGVTHPNAQLELQDVGLNRTRIGLIDALRAMGATIQVSGFHQAAGEPVADLVTRSAELRAIQVSGDLTARMIDEFPVFAVAATQAKGATIVRDAQELRVKESNRIDGLVEELRKMGAQIEATADGFVVQGPVRLRGALVDARGDHRMAMALAVAALIAEGETIIAGAECVSKTFPRFFENLGNLSE
jgi:3-phosphoshikimate 1-carboxyvinyltransferase